MLKGWKYRLYPNKAQSELINKHIGACRFVYNLALETKNYAYAANRKNLTCFDLMGQLPDLKKECDWLKEIDSQALQQSIINLDKAFTSFFKGHAAFPNFKSKKKCKQSFRNPHGSKAEVKEGKLYQPKFKDGIKIVIDRPFIGDIKSTTISRTPTGKYFVSILTDNHKELPKKKPVKENTAVGIDLGLSHFIITSDGIKVENPKHLRNILQRIKVLQRRLRNKKKGSSRKKNAYHTIAVLHEKSANQRKDFLHKLSTQLVNNHDTLCFETLQVQNMQKNHKLALSISDAGWGMFVDFCKYKAEWNGKNVLQIPTFQPSSKICNICGSTNHTLTLADRQWTCENGHTLDRDVNASINIKAYALHQTGKVIPEVHVELPTLVGTMKREVPVAR